MTCVAPWLGRLVRAVAIAVHHARHAAFDIYRSRDRGLYPPHPKHPHVVTVPFLFVAPVDYSNRRTRRTSTSSPLTPEPRLRCRPRWRRPVLLGEGSDVVVAQNSPLVSYGCPVSRLV